MSRIRKVETDDITIQTTVSRKEANALREFIDICLSYPDIEKLVEEKSNNQEQNRDMISIVDEFLDELFDALS